METEYVRICKHRCKNKVGLLKLYAKCVFLYIISKQPSWKMQSVYYNQLIDLLSQHNLNQNKTFLLNHKNLVRLHTQLLPAGIAKHQQRNLSCHIYHKLVKFNQSFPYLFKLSVFKSSFFYYLAQKYGILSYHQYKILRFKDLNYPFIILFHIILFIFI